MRKALGALPQWGLNKDGQPLIPVVTQDTLELLQALTAEAAAIGAVNPSEGTTTEATADGEPTAEAAQAQTQEAARTLWGALRVNSVVLAPEDEADGWWEAIILAIHDDTCTLCWRDYPEHGLVRRQREQLAVMHPAP